MKLGRNDPCNCGSGKKYKKCCERQDETNRRLNSELWQVEINGRSCVCTAADKKDYENERNLAMHEAAHAVAHWIMGHEISYMQFNSVDDSQNHGEKLAAVTVGVTKVGEIMALPIGARIVATRKHAFVTLAGVFGSTDAQSDNPLRQLETADHLWQAASKFMYFLGMSKEEAAKETVRLVPIVNKCFDDKAVWNLVNILAAIFHQKRRLEGEEVIELINAMYPACKAAAAEGQIAALKNEEA